MSKQETTPKHVNFADGRQRDTIESTLKELSPLMPPKDRGVMSRGILWAVTHFKAMHDDLEALRDRVKTSEKEVNEKLTALSSKLTMTEKERDQMKAQIERHPQEPGKRTLEQSKALFQADKCPICEGELQHVKGQYGDYVQCRSCQFRFTGRGLETLSN